jgi:cytoskeletal protein RodZ
MILSIINMLLILVILFVLIVQIHKDNKQQEEIEDLEKQVKKLNKYRKTDKRYSQKKFKKTHDLLSKQNNTPSLLDLREFQHINPTIKEFYKKYFTDKIMQSVIRQFNKNIKENNTDKFLKQNEDLIADYVDSIVNEIDHLPVEKIKYLEYHPDDILLFLSSFSEEKEEELDKKHKKLNVEIRRYN